LRRFVGVLVRPVVEVVHPLVAEQPRDRRTPVDVGRAFCAADQEELDANQLSATPLYYGLWAFRQVPQGRFVDLDLDDSYLDESAPTASRARAAP